LQAFTVVLSHLYLLNMLLSQVVALAVVGLVVVVVALAVIVVLLLAKLLGVLAVPKQH
jgi:hypothetical protein